MERAIAVDLVEVGEIATGDLVATLAWGDVVEVVRETDEHVDVLVTKVEEQDDGSRVASEVRGRILRPRGADLMVAPEQLRVLRVDFVDVQQGDGAVMQTPGGKVVLIDGGDNQLFARYLAGKFRGTTRDRPQVVDAIVVSHGDADHFKGLPEIRDSEDLTDQPTKQLFIEPHRVFHNGLVKRTGGDDVEDDVLFGETAAGADGRRLIVNLREDLLEVPSAQLNRDFRAWKDALRQWDERHPIEFRRLELGSDGAFDFLAEPKLRVEVLGPLTVETADGRRRGLPFLGDPLPRVGHPETAPRRFSSRPSASHTINGHSIVLRIVYDRWSILFAGDLNEQAEEALIALDRARAVNLRSEVLKVPHHGSADFLHAFLDAVAPVVSIVSSGDDDKEHIHPRATLVAGLGRHGRPNDPVLFVTELVAFFRSEGWVQAARKRHRRDRVPRRRGAFFGFSRSAFGTVRVRTDGRRLLVYTDSGRDDMKEAYAYTLMDGRTRDGTLEDGTPKARQLKVRKVGWKRSALED